MINYETIYIAHPDLSESKISEINTRLSEVIQRFNGKLNNSEDWGNRTLGYTIEKQHTGHYVYLNYNASPGVVSELERTLQIREDVLKHMTVRLTKKE